MKNCVIYCTVPNEFNANLIATTLVEDNLAACCKYYSFSYVNLQMGRYSSNG